MNFLEWVMCVLILFPMSQVMSQFIPKKIMLWHTSACTKVQWLVQLMGGEVMNLISTLNCSIFNVVINSFSGYVMSLQDAILKLHFRFSTVWPNQERNHYTTTYNHCIQYIKTILEYFLSYLVNYVSFWAINRYIVKAGQSIHWRTCYCYPCDN